MHRWKDHKKGNEVKSQNAPACKRTTTARKLKKMFLDQWRIKPLGYEHLGMDGRGNMGQKWDKEEYRAGTSLE